MPTLGDLERQFRRFQDKFNNDIKINDKSIKSAGTPVLK